MTIALLGCEKPNPTPEVGDSIYSSYKAEADAAGKLAESEKKKLVGLKKELLAAKPQTGDAKIIQRQYFEAEKKVQQYLQEQFYYSLRAKSRQEDVRKAYTAAFKAKKTYDSSEEQKAFDSYKTYGKSPGNWDSKRRIANYHSETGFGTPAGAKTEKPAQPASSGH